MFASLYVTDGGLSGPLLDLAKRFSPEVEQSREEQRGHTVTFSITPLRKMIGSPHQIASEICRTGHEYNLRANLAIAANPDAAILLARHFMGVTLVTPGDERLKLAPIPLAKVFEYDTEKLLPSMLEILLRWGIKTCEDLAALPEKGIAERLGPMGVYLLNLAAGNVRRPLRLHGEPANYEVRMELEYSFQLLEPLLFLLGRAIGELCQRLRSQSRAARELEVKLYLDAAPGVDDEQVREQFTAISAEDRKNPAPYICRLEFPLPLDDPRNILKLLHLHLERHPPGAPVRAFFLWLEAVEPRRVQSGIFLPPTPAPNKLQVTLARIASMVGEENVGTPVLLNTHRPDAFTNKLLPEHEQRANFRLTKNQEEAKPEMPRLAMRLFRPALHARVQVRQLAPKNVVAAGIRGHVLQYAGPWKTAGEWWINTAWSREEWDVALDDGALYRIYQESTSHKWFIYGIYD